MRLCFVVALLNTPLKFCAFSRSVNLSKNIELPSNPKFQKSIIALIRLETG